MMQEDFEKDVHNSGFFAFLEKWAEKCKNDGFDSINMQGTMSSIVYRVMANAEKELLPKFVAYCSTYGGFGLSPSFLDFYDNNTEQKANRHWFDHDREKVASLLVPFGKLMKKKYPKQFCLVLQYICEGYNPVNIHINNNSDKYTDKIEFCTRLSQNLQKKELWDCGYGRFNSEIMSNLTDRLNLELLQLAPKEKKEKAYLEFGLQCASTQYCRLEIEKVPALTKYKICEYDGEESVW